MGTTGSSDTRRFATSRGSGAGRSSVAASKLGSSPATPRSAIGAALSDDRDRSTTPPGTVPRGAFGTGACTSPPTRLLWRYAERKGDRAVLALPEPTVGDPLPVHLDGRLISQDLANTALEVDAMRRGGATGPTSIVEIGAGYGRTAYALLALHPKATYTIVDIEPALSISRWYLSQLVDPARVSFVDAGDIGTVRDRRFDLGVSISSLQEMTPDQVGEYLELLDCIVDGHVYLKQWETWHNPIDDVDLVFDQYRIPSRWQRTLWERCPVQTRFMQGVWQT